MKSAKPAPKRLARSRTAKTDADGGAANLTRSRGERGAIQISASAPSAPPRANNSGKDSGSRGGAENAEDLPEGWTSAPLDALVEFNPKHPATLADDTPVSFIPMPAVSETSPVLDVSQTRPLGSVRKGYTHFADGDVLFAKITPCMENGKGAVASGLKNGLGCGTTELVVMRSRGAVDPLFLYRFLAQPSIRSAAKDSFTGSAGQARVPASFLQELEIPLPPLAEQRRIVAKLEELLGKVEASRQRLAQVPALLKRFRQAVLAAACSGRLTADWRNENSDTEPAVEIIHRLAKQSGKPLSGLPASELPIAIPESWECIQAQDLARPSEIITYGVLKPVWIDGGIPTVRVQDMKLGEIAVADVGRCCPVRVQKFTKTTLAAGDLLIAKDGATLGKTAFVPPSLTGGNITQHVLRFPISALVKRVFVRLVIDSRHGQDWMKSETKGVALPGVNVGDFRRMPIPLPPLPEQEEIVRRVEALFAVADRLEARFAQARAQVDRLAPALLAKAFRGELVPQDPRDPPAAAPA